jgi:hypothetical protein
MERVAFLIEHSGERVGCMLNPESLVVRRLAGVEPRRSAGGLFTGGALSDDPLLYTGGGSTELLLDLLFDTAVAGSSVTTEDVRELTGPLFRLAENPVAENDHRRPPLVRFVWGKSWNIPGIVAAIAERFERFTPAGAPTRSWLRMRFLRVPEASPAEARAMRRMPVSLSGQAGAHEVDSADRLDQIAQHHYGDPSVWRLLAAFNGLADPARIPPGRVIQVPPLSVLLKQTQP